MATVLTHPDAVIQTELLPSNRRRIRVKANDPGLFVATCQWETNYPDDLLARILDVKGPGWLLDEVRRDEDPHYVEDRLMAMLTYYEPRENFKQARICDFGCGSGASSMILARHFPQAAIVGVDISEKLLAIARARRDWYRAEGVRYVTSPSGQSVPDDIGQFDYVILSGVYEHLLPEERLTLMPQVWSLVKPGGMLFVDDTPHRYFPIESHTTGLPLINYLPDRLAHRVSTRLSRRLVGDESWQTLLRDGIRGATAGSIAKSLSAAGGASAMLVEPTHPEVNDRIELWYRISSGRRMPLAKRGLRALLNGLKSATGITLMPTLDLAFRKALDKS